MKKQRFLLLIAVLLISMIPAGRLQAAAPTGYDLISAVNDLRGTNGLAAIDTNSALMSAAQDHADYLASNLVRIITKAVMAIQAQAVHALTTGRWRPATT